MPQSRDDCPPSARAKPPLPVDLRGLDWTAGIVFAVLLALGVLVGVNAMTTSRDALRAQEPAVQAALP